jgi:hypothetical protein
MFCHGSSIRRRCLLLHSTEPDRGHIRWRGLPWISAVFCDCGIQRVSPSPILSEPSMTHLVQSLPSMWYSWCGSDASQPLSRQWHRSTAPPRLRRSRRPHHAMGGILIARQRGLFPLLARYQVLRQILHRGAFNIAVHIRPLCQ